MTRIIALVPARDESASIAETVTALRSMTDGVIVVDDGSTDATAVLARNAGASVVEMPRAVGKGAALDRGLATIDRVDAVLLADGDLGSSASGLGPVVEVVLRGEADLAIAAPTGAITGGLGVVRRLAQVAIRAVGGPHLDAPLSGQRVIAGTALARLRPFAAGFGVETAMSMDAARSGLRIVEVPVAFTHRSTGRDLRGFIHRGRQGLHILRAIVPRLLRRP